MRHTIGLLIVAAVFAILPRTAVADPLSPASSTPATAELRPGLRDALSGILHYPKDVRDAALELSPYPELVLNLRYADASGPALARQLDAYPPNVQSAARTVAAHGDVLAVLQRHLFALGGLAKSYSDNPQAVRAMVDRLSEQTMAENQLGRDAWVKRLEADPAVAQQYAAALDEFAKAGGGLAFEKTSFPTPEQAMFIVRSADRYPELAGGLVDQWETQQNPEPFRQAMDRWYAERRDTLPEVFGADAASRAKTLKEQVAFERAYQEAVQKSKTIPPSQLEFLQGNEKTYPALTEVQSARAYAIASAKSVRVGGGPWTGSGGGGGSSGRGGSSTSSRGSGNSFMGSGSSMGSRSSSSRSRGGDLSMGGSRNSRGRNNSSSGLNNSRNSSSSRRGSSRGSGSGGFGGSSGFGGGSGGFGGGGFGGGGFGGGGFGGGSSGFGSGGGGNSGRSSFGSSGSTRNR